MVDKSARRGTSLLRSVDRKVYVSSTLSTANMESRTVGALIGLENRDEGKLSWGFDPSTLRQFKT